MIEVILIALAATRLSWLLVKEDGPWDAFIHLRALGGVPKDGVGPSLGLVRKFTAGVLSCTWCCSLWTCTGLWLLTEYVDDRPVQVLSIAALAILVLEVIKWLDHQSEPSSR